MLRKPHGMPVLLVLAVILLLSGCAADPGVGLRDESGDNAAAATALLEEAKTEFQRRTAAGYTCPIPADAVPTIAD